MIDLCMSMLRLKCDDECDDNECVDDGDEDESCDDESD